MNLNKVLLMLFVIILGNSLSLAMETQTVNERLLLQVSNDAEPRKIEATLGMGADVNATDVVGDTPLILATRNGNVEVVNLLLREGADKNKTNYSGQTAYDIALEQGNESLMKILMSKGSTFGTARRRSPTGKREEEREEELGWENRRSPTGKREEELGWEKWTQELEGESGIEIQRVKTSGSGWW